MATRAVMRSGKGLKMDEYNARLFSAMSDILLGIELEDPGEQLELRKIARRLKALSAGRADDVCCDRTDRQPN